jgi:dihydroflavonol-4-reductase
MIASTTCPIGRGDDAPTPTGGMIRDFLRGRFPFSCRTGLNFIGVDDLAEGLQHVANAGQPGERYLLSHENMWLKDFLQQLALETDRTPPAICLPDTLVRVIGVLGEIADLAGSRTGTARVCLETALQAGRRQFFSNAKAQRELGWQPAQPIGEAMREAVAWFRDEAEIDFVPTAEAPVGSHVR